MCQFAQPVALLAEEANKRRLPVHCEGFRMPAAELAAPSLMRPASETLHIHDLVPGIIAE
jgi:hypothetical protein